MPGRLLIAEDSRTQREVLREHLQQAGYDVVAAPDGERALEHLQQDSFDMLVSDVVMPGMDGYELCRRAKEHDRRLPVVLLTSMTDPLDVVNGLQAGADNFLRKPYEFGHLRSRIEMMLHNKSLRDAGQTQMGLELFFLNRRFMITAERQQILDLLVSTFEDLVSSNLELRRQESDLAAARDAVAQQLAEAQAQRDRLETVLASVPQALVVVEGTGTVTNASAALARFVGTVDVGELQGRRVGEVLTLRQHSGELFGKDERPIARALRDGVDVHCGQAFDVLAERADGKSVPVLLHASPVQDAAGRTTGAVGILQEIEALSLHDPLTHLPGHTSFARSVDSAVAAVRSSELVAVVVLLVDRRSELSDSLGRERTDALVIRCADRLREALELSLVRQCTTDREAGYFGDSTFAIVLSGLDDEARAVLVAEAVRRHMSGLYDLDGLEPTVTVTAGLATTAHVDPAAPVGSAAQQLVPAAANAAQLGSRGGGGRVESSSPGAIEAAADQLRQETDLRRGVEQGELHVYYQPIMSLEDGVSGVEALVRWQHRGTRIADPGRLHPARGEDRPGRGPGLGGLTSELRADGTLAHGPAGC